MEARENAKRSRRHVLTGMLLLAATVALLVPAAGQSQTGGSLPGLQGGSLGSSDLAKGTYVIVVWAGWSPKCRDIVARVNELSAKVAGARLVTVNFQEEAADVEKFLAGKGLSVPVYLDGSGDFSKAHAVTTLPGLIVYRDGQVKFQGRLEADAVAQVESQLR